MYCYECVESPPRFAHPLNPLPLLLLAGGRLFDPVGFSRGDEAMYKKYKQNEIVNGRLVRTPPFPSPSSARCAFGLLAQSDMIPCSQQNARTRACKRMQAMVANLGFWAQYAATGKGPIQNLSDHLADPYHTTFTTNGVSVPFLN
jgi:hypothetical protein